MSHSSINDKLRQLARDIQAGVDNSELVKAISMPNEQHINSRLVPDTYSVDRANLFMSRCVLVKPKHTGWLVLQRLRHTLGKSFTASSLFETKTDAELYASNFDNVVAIMPIEWEE